MASIRRLVPITRLSRILRLADGDHLWDTGSPARWMTASASARLSAAGSMVYAFQMEHCTLGPNPVFACLTSRWTE